MGKKREREEAYEEVYEMRDITDESILGSVESRPLAVGCEFTQLSARPMGLLCPTGVAACDEHDLH